MVFIHPFCLFLNGMGLWMAKNELIHCCPASHFVVLATNVGALWEWRLSVAANAQFSSAGRFNSHLNPFGPCLCSPRTNLLPPPRLTPSVTPILLIPFYRPGATFPKLLRLPLLFRDSDGSLLACVAARSPLSQSASAAVTAVALWSPQQQQTVQLKMMRCGTRAGLLSITAAMSNGL